MYEVELKVPADHQAVRTTIEAMSATSLSTVHQRDTYYNAPHRDFATTDEALRLRQQRAAGADTWQAELTYKGPLVDDQSKTREEIEIDIDEPTQLDTILERLGFEATATVEKTRERYQIDELLVTLDAVDELGEFVEIETETDSDIDHAREQVYACLDKLGLDAEETIQTSYLGLLLEQQETTS